MKGCIFDIAEGTIHDGPGLRITVFMKGCPLHCRWCHSPEGQSPEPQRLHPAGMPPRLCGHIWESGELAAHLRDRCELLSNGGITFSGGEPLQQGEFLLDVMSKLNGCHLLLDTCGFAEEELFLQAARRADLVFFGLKLLDDREAREWTGQPAAAVKRNLLRLDRECTTPYRLRIPLLDGVTGRDSYLRELQVFSQELKRAERIDFLPSNPDAGAKYHSCGRDFNPGFDIRKQPELPGWFQPAVPFRLLNSNEVE